jgi:hypothetical protein
MPDDPHYNLITLCLCKSLNRLIIGETKLCFEPILGASIYREGLQVRTDNLLEIEPSWISQMAIQIVYTFV